MRRFVEVLRSFHKSGTRPFFVAKRWKYRLIAWSGLIFIIALLLANVWATLMLSYRVYDLGVAVQYGATWEHYLWITKWILLIMALFMVTDPIVNEVFLPIYTWYWAEASMTHHLDVWDMRTTVLQGASQRIKDCSQKIAADISTLFIRVFRCFIGFWPFAFVLWGLSTHYSEYLLIPGSLLWIMLIVSVIETAIAWYLGRKLAKQEKNRQSADAALRTSFENEEQKRSLESVAEDRLLWRRENYKLVSELRWQTLLYVFFSVPLILWRHLSGNFWGYGLQLLLGWLVAVMTLFPYGVMWQTINVVGEVHRSLSIFTETRAMIATLEANIERQEEIREIEETLEKSQRPLL